MNNLNILIVEGNNRKDSQFFIKVAGASAADNLKNLILKIEPSSNIEIINPDNDHDTTNALKNMSQYNGIIFTGGAMRINDMTDVIKKHLIVLLKKKDFSNLLGSASLLNCSWW